MTGPITKLSPDAISFLERWSWFRALSPKLRSLILFSAIEKFAAPGDFVARAGEPSLYWYGLLRGFLQMYIAGQDGSETTLYCMGEGEWGGDGSLLKAEMRRYDLRSLTHTHMILIPATSFEVLRANSIEFNQFICEIMNDRIAVFVGMLVAARLSGADVQFANALMMLASNANKDAQEILIPQHELALICGLSRQRVNAAIATFVRKNILHGEPRKGQLVVDMARLKEYVAKYAA